MAAAGAEYLQSIFGTEKDRVNCPFYFKIGACRHGDKCERRHNKPTLSQTLLIVSMYQNPVVLPNYDEKKGFQYFEEFYEDIYEELSQYGEIEELNVCDNICDHMMGNVYVKYTREEEAERSLRSLTGRFYGGRPIVAEFSPVTDFREASCRQYEMHECTRGGHCNFMHLKQISRELYRTLFKGRPRPRRSKSPPPANKGRSRRERSRSRSPRDKKSRRSRSRSRSPKERKDRHRDERRKGDSKESDEKRRRRDSPERERSRERSHEKPVPTEDRQPDFNVSFSLSY